MRLTQTKAFNRIALVDMQKKSDGYTSNFNLHSYMGMKGTTYTVLRPSGKIFVDGEIKDAFTRGEFIEKGKNIEVIDEGGTSLKVKEIY